MVRSVKGVLFSDYVRMIRAVKSVDWTKALSPEDMALVLQVILPERWYPMAAFERLGDAILREVAKGDLNVVRVWGRFSADPLHEKTPELVAKNDPVETLMRFRVLRRTYFDFQALELPILEPDHAQIAIRYYMGPTAEEAAAHQTMGFFERLVELAGGDGVTARFTKESWKGDSQTLVDLHWWPARR